MMKKTLLSLLLVFTLSNAFAAGGAAQWDEAPDRSHNLAALQRGAALFVNYCLNCHSASFVRYSSLNKLGFSSDQIKSNLMFTAEKTSALMQSNQDPLQAKDWFGKTPPDLSLVARSRAGSGGSGSDYLYTFLRGFYVSPSKVTGWDNVVFPNVGMPNVLWELQGFRTPEYETVAFHNEETKTIKGFKLIAPGKLDEEAFGNQVADLVAFMTWMAEPSKANRIQIGAWAILFLLLFILIAWRLSASFWKDVK